ncbi:YtxH domain-containing protein [Flavobacterium ardleyense]|uniref:YtxH domain-containing protein n=1 Tax=Flavobacterium ardleyense TaxID=2038737 RepID=A0ABW5Z4E4_9FLAO
MKNRNNDIGTIAGSFIVGALIGATVGVLFAPHKGKKTRKLISKAVQQTTESFTSKFKGEIEDIEYETIGNLPNTAPGFENFLEGKMINSATSFKDKVNQRPNPPVNHKMVRK